MVLTIQGQNNGDGTFNWKDAVCDAAITAFLTFFTTLGGATILEVGGKAIIMTAAISSASQFFLFLALKRGLRKVEPQKLS